MLISTLTYTSSAGFEHSLSFYGDLTFTRQVGFFNDLANWRTDPVAGFFRIPKVGWLESIELFSSSERSNVYPLLMKSSSWLNVCLDDPQNVFSLEGSNELSLDVSLNCIESEL